MLMSQRVLLPIAQAVTFLVIHQKHKKSLEEITNDLCPVLSVQQLYRIRCPFLYNMCFCSPVHLSRKQLQLL